MVNRNVIVENLGSYDLYSRGILRKEKKHGI